MCVGKLKFTSTLISLGKVGDTIINKLQYYQQAFEKQILITRKEKQKRKITSACRPLQVVPVDF